jgi:cytochrome c peroxidase
VSPLPEARCPWFEVRPIIALPLLFLGIGCAGHDSDAQPSTTGAPLSEAVAPDGFPMGGVTQTAPTDNQLTEPRAQLGRRLFYETNLSRTRDVSCGTCHRQRHGFADPAVVSPGVDGRLGTRNASALANLAWSGRFFWDGRAASLEEQAGQPIENSLEMDLPLAEAISRLEADESYVTAFRAAYDEEISTDNLQRAIASFVRVLVSGQSSYDRHLAGDDSDFSAAAQRGEQLFFSERAECFHCHPHGALTNDGLFNNGSYREGVASTVFLGAVAILIDVWVASRVMELYWPLVGAALAAAALRINRRPAPSPPSAAAAATA